MKCNLCGKEMDLFDEQQDLTIHKVLGYGSRYDGDEVELRICNDCFDLLIAACVESPVTEGA